MLLDALKTHKGTLLDPLGLFHKEPKSSSHSYGSNHHLDLGPLSISRTVAISSATAQGNGVANSAANANSQALGGGSAKADASATANAQGI